MENINTERQQGILEGITQVAKWLESKDPIWMHLLNEEDKDGAWTRIAEALGRENELNGPSTLDAGLAW